jgi:transposase
MKKEFEESVGIDVSKLTLDVFLHHKSAHTQVLNNSKGFVKMLRWVEKEAGSLRCLIWCFEHTGWYCVLLNQFMHEKGMHYCCVNPLEIKRSLGFSRGKTDKQDAKGIARFAWLRREELSCSKPMPLKLIELQRSMSLREQLVKQSTALKCLEKGMKVTIKKMAGDKGLKVAATTIEFIAQQIAKVESQMIDLLKTDAEMHKNYKLAKTVKGVGPILSIQILLHTHNFTRFEKWRQFASYCGIAPFQYRSGTSVYRRPKIHSISDKKMKSLLSMSAGSAIRSDKELMLYFKKRVEEGKPKRVVLNIIRNKIVSRVFATVKRGTPFVEMNNIAG